MLLADNGLSLEKVNDEGVAWKLATSGSCQQPYDLGGSANRLGFSIRDGRDDITASLLPIRFV
ncbi:hypothetical protein VIBNIAM115_80013 [Vibrio nigripulchritudo AM115]|nr:hypothetical protein VIBNIAM115_80013 [Vibrio nigripulchritudo AM115]